jgi:hypothetical protein
VALMDQPRYHRKMLVAVALARSQCGSLLAHGPPA